MAKPRPDFDADDVSKVGPRHHATLPSRISARAPKPSSKASTGRGKLHRSEEQRRERTQADTKVEDEVAAKHLSSVLAPFRQWDQSFEGLLQSRAAACSVARQPLAARDRLCGDGTYADDGFDSHCDCFLPGEVVSRDCTVVVGGKEGIR